MIIWKKKKIIHTYLQSSDIPIHIYRQTERITNVQSDIIGFLLNQMSGKISSPSLSSSNSNRLKGPSLSGFLYLKLGLI